MAHDVFISYSTKDRSIANAICTNLETNGIRCWIAPRDIIPGEDWPTAITSAISQSRVMVLVFSANSNTSDDVGREIILAANSKLVIIPFKIDDIEPEPGKQYYLARTHWLDAINPPTREQILLLVQTVKGLIPFIPGEERGGQPVSGNEQKKTPRARYRWLPVALVLLAIVGWVIFSRISRVPPLSPGGEAQLGTPAALDWNVNVSDNFTSNTRGWPRLNNSDDGCSVLNMNVQSGSLVWDLKPLGDNECGYVFYPGISSVSDFDVSMDAMRRSGTGEVAFGLGFRIVNAENHYSFIINDAARNYTVKRIQNNFSSSVIDWTYDPVIRGDGYNSLTVMARGSAIYFYINDKLMGSMEDAEIPSGFIGIIAETFNGGEVSVSFDNFVLHGIR